MEYTTIGEACTLHARIGWQGLTKSEYLDEGDYYLVTGVDFNNGHIAFDTCHFVTKERYDQDHHIQLQLNDVLVTKDGTIGKVAFIDRPFDKPATLNSGVFVVRPRNPTSLLPEYLMIMLMSNHFSRFIEQIKVGCTIAHLNQEKFLRYQFPLPPVAEQKHIIEVYDSASRIINQRQRQLLALDTLIKARFVEMFGDPSTNDKGFATILGSDSFKLSNGKFVPESKRFDVGIPVYGGNGVSWYTDEVLHATDTIVVGRVGFQSGNVHLVRGPLWISDNAMYISDIWDSEIDLRFLYHVMEHIDFTRFQDAGDLKKITQKPFMMMQYIKPPIDMQLNYISFVSQVDKSKVVVQKALNEAQLLFDSLMQQYFG